MEINCYLYKLADGKIADYFATEEAIIAMQAIKLDVVYATVYPNELDKFGRISIATLQGLRKYTTT
jgi:hypothetical protein